MMLKLFLVTLLCTTLVFANQPVQNFQDAWWKSVSGFVGKGDHGSLVRRFACGPWRRGGQGGNTGGQGGGGEGGTGGGGEGGTEGEAEGK